MKKQYLFYIQKIKEKDIFWIKTVKWTHSYKWGSLSTLKECDYDKFLRLMNLMIII